MTKNNYDAMSKDYNKSHEKPDKKYAMLPTLLNMAGDLSGKVGLDVGCGDGFFTQDLSRSAKSFIGIDNSLAQINQAKKRNLANVDFQRADMFDFEYGSYDLVSCPFVLNYVQEVDRLSYLVQKFYQSLNEGGALIGILDTPKDILHDAKAWGSIKRVNADKLEEGAQMEIDLYHNEEKLVTLHSFYHAPETVKSVLKNAGFSNFSLIEPVISPEGMEKFGSRFWQEYKKECDVTYFKAEK